MSEAPSGYTLEQWDQLTESQKRLALQWGGLSDEERKREVDRSPQGMEIAMMEAQNRAFHRAEDGKLQSNAPVPGKEMDRYLAGLQDARANKSDLHALSLEKLKSDPSFRYDGRYLRESQRYDIQYRFEAADRRYQRSDRDVTIHKSDTAYEYRKQAELDRFNVQKEAAAFDLEHKTKHALNADDRMKDAAKSLDDRKQEDRAHKEKLAALDQQRKQDDERAIRHSMEIAAKREESQVRMRPGITADLDGYQSKLEPDHIAYSREGEKVAFREYGYRVDVRKDVDIDTRRDAFKLAAEKFDGPMTVKGSKEFKRQTALFATELGIQDRFQSKEMAKHFKDLEETRKKDIERKQDQKQPEKSEKMALPDRPKELEKTKSKDIERAKSNKPEVAKQSQVDTPRAQAPEKTTREPSQKIDIEQSVTATKSKKPKQEQTNQPTKEAAPALVQANPTPVPARAAAPKNDRWADMSAQMAATNRAPLNPSTPVPQHQKHHEQDR